jgi:hypothetical protein
VASATRAATVAPARPQTSATATSWSRSSAALTPTIGGAAPGRNRTPIVTDPGASRTVTGRVAGPATATSPSTETRSTHASGSTGWS